MDIHLKLLRKACLAVATKETAYDGGKYDGKSPLEGHCAAVAYIVHGIFGGEIVTGRIVYNGESQPHYWNRLPNGTEVDLTSCQFGGDGYTPLKKGRKVKRGELVPLRFLMFAELVRQHLEVK